MPSDLTPATTSATFTITNAERQFTLFPKLPPELRLKIWTYALPGPRLFPFPTLNPFKRETVEVTRRCQVFNSLITIARVCRESRSVLEDNYQKINITSLARHNTTEQEQNSASVISIHPGHNDVKGEETCNPYIFINYDTDALYFQTTVRPYWMEHILKCFDGLQHLVYDESCVADFKLRWEFKREWCPNVKRITFACTWDFRNHPYGEEWKLVEIPQTFKNLFAIHYDPRSW